MDNKNNEYSLNTVLKEDIKKDNYDLNWHYQMAYNNKVDTELLVNYCYYKKINSKIIKELKTIRENSDNFTFDQMCLIVNAINKYPEDDIPAIIDRCNIKFN